ncbi:hypothetical protein EGI22_22740 [Lacihabitans sp. LS3-19]|uniref:hypothetical protein n=1 Tax=Lacihabitans sp. LS3-19 TaxID=2487335 RepID=UPI0020CCB8F0|nr:hypothetical protein [Lacihabitans sp. LS3-19]MCP9770733.1 hypothetical protein [Lacihabitans sp. LS3-19]
MNKDQILIKAKEILEKKLKDLDQAILNVQSAANEESKSSMGDKYETGRAMAQNDRAMLEHQKIELVRDIFTFENTNFTQETDSIKTGSIVETSLGCFLVCISLGKIIEAGKTIMLISTVSPIGAIMMGKKANESINMNGREIKILKVY